ncbi:MAG TPA: bifunctional allantoicase/OHCU decarboxylase [Acidobacteria bacterium]|nr:bifunctional allantoicase/OHCU decarboxylase [Acidobacteriota bacterium]
MSDFTDLVDLASERLGGAVLAANDEFFAPKENLLKAHAAVWKEGEYTDVGKWMDGWETRRRREPGFDWCLVRLGLPGLVHGVVVDTSFFRGNYPESCSLEACALDGHPSPADLLAAAWTEILPRVPLQGNAKNLFPLERRSGRITHLRLSIYPDGGVARLRVHGEAVPDWPRLLRRQSEIDLAGVENGGAVLSCSDMFFGNRHNLILPGPSLGMHDGWETKRRRGPGHDWAIVRLATRAALRRVEVDTSHFKGNAPGSCSIEACDAPASTGDQVAAEGFSGWREILPPTPLRPHTRHLFDDLAAAGPFTHARLNIFPDGGVARLRLFGTVTPIDWLNALPGEAAEAALLACCGSRVWARRMVVGRPYRDRADLVRISDGVWWSLAAEDWLEAFRAHPRIGEKGGRWSEQEQAGARGARPEVLADLVAANRRYEERFGHLFIVCATGKSAAEMLALLQERIGQDPASELRTAAEEQRKITHLRLEKLLP